MAENNISAPGAVGDKTPATGVGARDNRARVYERVSDGASAEMLSKAYDDCVSTVFERMDAQKNQCQFGRNGVCCRICHMGPCRITPKSPRGVCGADADTIAARNFLREVTGGTSAHSDHGRHLVLKLKKVASEGMLKADAMTSGETPAGASPSGASSAGGPPVGATPSGATPVGGYAIKDEAALRRAARQYGVEEEGRDKNAVAFDLANVFLGDYSEQEGYLRTLDLAPRKRRDLWTALGIKPNGVDRMVVEAMHRTTMGVDHDYKNLLMHAFRTSLADGWGGSRIASITADILFGTPSPIRGVANLGVIKADTVNILIHGHEPTLSEMLAVAASDPEITAYAKAAGAAGVTLAGMCCTANEILMRHGIPVAGNVLQQELALVTGAVEMMVVDVQCCMPSLPDVAKGYHTHIVSTVEMAKTIGAIHAAFDESNPLASAKELIRKAVDNYKNRDAAKVRIPDGSEPLVAGFSVDAIKYMLGGRFRASFRPLNDAIIQNRILGVVGIVGCNNAKQKADDYTLTLTKELLKRNILVLQTGCAAIASAKAGMMTPEIAFELAGPGLREVCEAVGMPPILHLGSCVDNSRVLEAATEIVMEGGLGDDLASVPAVGVAPEWMSEKAVAIGCYFVASGVDVILGNPFYVAGSENVTRYLHEGAKDDFGACFHLIEDPLQAADRIVEMLNEARGQLGINKKAERKLYDMKDRRDL